MSSSTQDLLPNIDLTNTFGALFLGVITAALLFGINNVQAFIYFQTNRGTGMALYKFVVIGLWILDALHLALITHCVYYYLVANYANFSAFTEIVWSFKAQTVVDFPIIYGVHILYAYRIWIVSKGRSRALPIIVGIFLIVTSSVPIVFIWAVYRCHTFADLAAVEWSAYMAFGTIAFNDLIIASSLCYFLATSRTGFSSTDSFVTKLMVYIINTGCLTSVCSLVGIITCAVMPKNFISLAFQFLIAKLYVTSCLALFNARHYLMPENTHTVDIPKAYHHGPLLHIKGSEAEKSQESQKIACQRPYGHDYELYPIPYRPVQFVMPQRPIVMTMEMNSVSSM